MLEIQLPYETLDKICTVDSSPECSRRIIIYNKNGKILIPFGEDKYSLDRDSFETKMVFDQIQGATEGAGEDKPLILRSITAKIETFSDEVSVVGEASNGLDALLFIEELNPDIVFTDIRMPAMDGLKLVAKAREKYEDLHFVIISGYDDLSKDYNTLFQGMSFIFEQCFTTETDNEIGSKYNREIISKVEAYSNTSFANPITIGEVAKMVNFHPVYLSRLFKGIKGVPPRLCLFV